MVRSVEVVSIIDAVTEGLRRRVLAGELPPGAPLAEVDVAAQYDVARPTAKAAIENLVRARLLERTAHKTARVVRLGSDDVRDIYRAREIIESAVVRELARERRVPDAARVANAAIAALVDDSPLSVVEPDMRFHTALVDGVGNERTARMYASLASEVVFCMSQVQGAALLSTASIADEHARLLDLIEAGDGEAAAELLAAHVRRASDRLAERLASARD